MRRAHLPQIRPSKRFSVSCGHGCLAQLVERRPYKANVGGSNPSAPTRVCTRERHGVVVQLVRIPACHAGGRGFESRPLRQLHNRRTRVRLFFGAHVPRSNAVACTRIEEYVQRMTSRLRPVRNRVFESATAAAAPNLPRRIDPCSISYKSTSG